MAGFRNRYCSVVPSIRRRRQRSRDSGAFWGIRSLARYCGASRTRKEPMPSRMHSCRRMSPRRWSVRLAAFTRPILSRRRSGILRGAELFEAGDPAAPSGLLLSGPSGTGKSLIGRTLAETMGCDFQKLSPADLKEEHLGASGKRVRAFRTARAPISRRSFSRRVRRDSGTARPRPIPSRPISFRRFFRNGMASEVTLAFG